MKHTKQILLVFPGLGKTYLAMRKPGIADCDFGYYRAGFNAAEKEIEFKFPGKEWLKENSLRAFAQRVLNIYAKEGFIVLTNEPELIPWIKQSGASIRMILPRKGVDMGARIMKREKEKPVNANWAKLYNDNWEDWVEDWRHWADRYSIPVIEAAYLNQDWSVIEHEL